MRVCACFLLCLCCATHEYPLSFFVPTIQLPVQQQCSLFIRSIDLFPLYAEYSKWTLYSVVQHLRLTTAGYGGYYTLHTTQRAGVESGGQACTRHTRVACDHKLRVTASGILHRKQHRNYEGIIEVRCVPCLRNYQRTSHTAAVKLTYNLQVNNVR